jgi:sigma-54 dependent transcriptional regulator, acetoin dehydrogenase operon transcriptional activator AcoR
MTKKEKTEHIQEVFSLKKAPENFCKATPPRSFVVRSWERCLTTHGLDPAAPYEPNVLSSSKLRDRRETLHRFLDVAKPYLGRLYRQVARSGKMVLLTDAQGVALESIRNPLFSDESEIPDPLPGWVLSEDHEGTNGIGMCLSEKRPLAIQRAEHFRATHIGHTCIVSPIFSATNELIAVLNASSVSTQEDEFGHFQALQLVNHYARLIEKANFLREFREEWVLRISLHPEISGSLSESLIAFNEDGRVVAADRIAHERLIDGPDDVLVGRCIYDLFDITLSNLMSRALPKPSLEWPIRSSETGIEYYGILRGPERDILSSGENVRRALEPNDETGKLSLTLDLDSLAGQDPQMVYNVGCLKRVMDKNIAIILQGETGTGKEAFAQAIHMASHRAKKPFVALNCASIPESLIESELFGYKAGAFTGAHGKGMRGKILQSDGGTLFLDEIGDMPLSLQTRLLRVLAEKEVTPLGGETSIPVELHVICATHRNLNELVATGVFREDLYYRLNGVTIKLPPLRERSDKEAIIELAFAIEAVANRQRMDLGKDAMKVLMDFSWPGNIRQLRNVLRFALAINESGTISLQDLPPEMSQQGRMRNEEQSWSAEPSFSDACDSDTSALSFLERSERESMLKSLGNLRWNITDSAKDLGLARATMYRKMKKYKIIPPNCR